MNKIVYVSIVILLTANSFINGQVTTSKQKTTSIRTPHQYSSAQVKQDTASTDLEAQTCKSWHDPGHDQPIVKDSAFSKLKETKSFFQTVGNFAFKYCPMCSKANTPDGMSASCLVCHDASVAQDRISRQPGEMLSNGAVNLFNSHPVSFVYDTVLNTELWPMTHVYNGTNTIKDLLDENNKVQCTSCHNMHSTEFPHFLKMSNEDSKLCLVCHKR